VTPELSVRYRDELQHVFWIGGPPDAGKSTTARIVADALGGSVYRQDGEEMNHLRRADRKSHPYNADLHSLVLSLPEPALLETLWLADSPQTMARQARLVWEERIDFICEYLLELPNDQPI
jgi:DNA polymerase III delta prime subunit